MLKKNLLLLCVLFVVGCSYGKEYLENPDTFIRDPHFTSYKKDLGTLESSYLKKEITYAEYVEEKDKIDQRYAKEVQERNSIISSD